MHSASVTRLLFFFVAALFTCTTSAAESVRLYAMDCGTLALRPPAMALFEDTDEYSGTAGEMVVPCFLIRHPKGDLLWDTGLGDELASQSNVELADGITARVTVTLAKQLQQLDLAPREIEFVAFSHHHFDHTGNTALFTNATFLMNAREMEWTRGSAYGVDRDSLRSANDANTQVIRFDHDVFRDGSVRILRAPGHTPGHQVLMVHLARAGTVVLSGDLYHTRENFRFSRVPAINYSRAETLATFDRIARFIRKYDARMIIQHDPKDFAALPKFPAYLD